MGFKFSQLVDLQLHSVLWLRDLGLATRGNLQVILAAQLLWRDQVEHIIWESCLDGVLCVMVDSDSLCETVLLGRLLG